jgi:hypothetical protein
VLPSSPAPRGAVGEMEEPYDLGQTFGGSFSPNSTLVRNSSPPGRPAGTTTIVGSVLQMPGHLIVESLGSNAREKIPLN